MTPRQLALHTIVVVAVLLALLVLWQVGVAVALFIAALALGACLFPVVEMLEERGWSRLPAIGITVLIGLALPTFAGLLLALPLAGDVERLISDVTTTVDQFATENPDHWLVKPFAAEEAPPDAAAVPPSPAVAQTVRSAVGTARDLIELSAQLAICVALAVYWTIDRARYERLWLSLVPVKRRTAAQKTWQAIERELGAYLRSELVQFLIAAMVLWAGFTMLGLRYPALSAVCAAVLFMIPWLGHPLALAAVALLATGKLHDVEGAWMPISGWVGLAYLVVVLAVLEFFVEPRLFKRDRYNSLWTILVTMAMTFTFGVWGLLLGPAVGFGIQILLRQLHPLFFYEPAPQASLDTIFTRLERLRERYADQGPPEVRSLLDRLDVLVESQAVAQAE